MQRIHDEEANTAESVVRSLLDSQCPRLADRPLTPLANTGTSNSLWRVHMASAPDCVVRLPRTPGAERSILTETKLLPSLGETDLGASLDLPTVLHAGVRQESFPFHWLVLSWIEGEDAWSERRTLEHSGPQLALELAEAVRTISALTGLRAPERRSGDRGGPLRPLLDRLNRWLEDPEWSADDLIDTAAVRRCAAQSLEVADETPTLGFAHGDLIPGNVLTVGGHLSGIIDWGGAGYGDVAQDLTPAWAILGRDALRIFRSALEPDEATWLRGKAFGLEQAVGGVLYYVPRRHPLGDVMTRTLSRILAD